MYLNNQYIKINCRIQLTIDELFQIEEHILNHDFGPLEEVKLVKVNWSNKKRRRVQLLCCGGRDYINPLFSLMLTLKKEQWSNGKNEIW